MGSCKIPSAPEPPQCGHVSASLDETSPKPPESDAPPKKPNRFLAALIVVVLAAFIVHTRFYRQEETSIARPSETYSYVLQSIPKWDRANMESLVEQLALGFREERALALGQKEAARCSKCVTLQQIQDYVAAYYVEHAQLALPSSDHPARNKLAKWTNKGTTANAKNAQIERAMKRLAISLRR